MIIKHLPVIHTWRDGSFYYDSEFDTDDKEIGALVIGNRLSLNSLIEIRHMKGLSITEWGEVFNWVKPINGEWIFEHLGKSTEQQIIENDN